MTLQLGEYVEGQDGAPVWVPAPADAPALLSAEEVSRWYAQLEWAGARDLARRMHAVDVMLRRRPEESEVEHVGRLTEAVEQLAQTVGLLLHRPSAESRGVEQPADKTRPQVREPAGGEAPGARPAPPANKQQLHTR